MNFDDLKKSWQEQQVPQKEIKAENVEKTVSNHPLVKLRKNVYKELWMQVLSIISLVFIPQVFGFNDTRTAVFYVIYTLFVLIMGYYLVKMFLFYKKSNTFSMNSFESLYESYYEVRLYIQLYESYCYSLIPFVFLVSFTSVDLEVLLAIPLKKLVVLLLATVAFSSMLTVIVAKVWINSFYGKYQKQIKNTLDLFKEKEGI